MTMFPVMMVAASSANMITINTINTISAESNMMSLLWVCFLSVLCCAAKQGAFSIEPRKQLSN